MPRSSRPLKLDRTRRKFLGVCAGVAHYLDVEPWTVRLAFLGCVLLGAWFLVPAYFVVWFLLDDNTDDTRSALANNLAVKHFRTVDYKKKVYRNTRDARWLGVCAGIADYLEMSPFALRLLFVLMFFTTAGFALLLYLAAWLVMEKAPDAVLPAPRPGRGSGAGRQGYNDREQTRATDPGAAVHARFQARHGGQQGAEDTLQDELQSGRREFQFCARKFRALQARLARMEAYVTSKRFQLHREFRNIS